MTPFFVNDKDMKRRIVQTEDGSSSVYIEEMDEHYHSTHGAIQEANHVFIKNGLNRIEKNELKIFELGFGTGLNAFLSFVNNQERMIKYDSIEAFPLEASIYENLNYVAEVGGEFEAIFKEIHSVDWGIESPISETFSLKKIHSKIQDFTIEKA